MIIQLLILKLFTINEKNLININFLNINFLRNV